MTEKLLKAGAAKLPISPTPDMLPLTLSFSGDLYEAVRNGEDISTRVIVLDNGEKDLHLYLVNLLVFLLQKLFIPS